ncbi:MAG TPA: WXG100 family type VII secretion target [Mycobacteriales bacterium]|jgi:uncharacterized protein YukE
MTTMAPSYQNELEQWYGELPPPVQEMAAPLYDFVQQALGWVAGDPGDLVRAGTVYPDIAQGIANVVAQQRADRQRLGSSWQGQAQDNFQERLAGFEHTLESLADAVRATPEILAAAAQACVDGANMIIDIVVMVVEAIIATFIANAALAVVTAGVSIAAGAAQALAECAVGAARIGAVVQKVGEVLLEIERALKTIGATLKKVAEFLRALQEELAALEKAADAERFLSGRWAVTKATSMAADATVDYAIHETTGVSVPGDVEAADHGAKAVDEIVNLSDDVRKVREADRGHAGG